MFRQVKLELKHQRSRLLIPKEIVRCLLKQLESTYSWFKVNLTAFANVWSSSTKENVDWLGSVNDPCSISYKILLPNSQKEKRKHKPEQQIQIKPFTTNNILNDNPIQHSPTSYNFASTFLPLKKYQALKVEGAKFLLWSNWMQMSGKKKLKLPTCYN